MKKILVLMVALFAIACTATKDATNSSSVSITTNQEENFYPLLLNEHIRTRKWDENFVRSIQVYVSKEFFLNSLSLTESDKTEFGKVIISENLITDKIKFPDKVKGTILKFDGTGALVQFHDGTNGKIGPPIWFVSSGSEFFLASNSEKNKIKSNGIVYTPTSWDVYLLFKMERGTKSKETEFTVSGLDVSGGASSDAKYGKDSVVPPVKDSVEKENNDQKQDRATQNTSSGEPKKTPAKIQPR